MTDQPETTADEAVDSTESAQQPVDAADQPNNSHDPAEAATPQREAAKWRVKFREAEARIARLQRAEAARVAAETLIDGDDLFASVELADLLDEDGDLDGDKITARVASLIEAKPHLRKAAFGDGAGIGTRGEPSARKQTWADVLSA